MSSEFTLVNSTDRPFATLARPPSRKAGPSPVDTKTAPPLLRPPLIDRSAVLGDVIGDSVVVRVHAPAGWGKTTRVAQWTSSRPDGSTCWVSSDEGDDDPVVFWRYIVTATHGARPALVPKTLRALQDSTDTSPDGDAVHFLT